MVVVAVVVVVAMVAMVVEVVVVSFAHIQYIHTPRSTIHGRCIYKLGPYRR